jgi:hypothetical protein
MAQLQTGRLQAIIGLGLLLVPCALLAQQPAPPANPTPAATPDASAGKTDPPDPPAIRIAPGTPACPSSAPDTTAHAQSTSQSSTSGGPPTAGTAGGLKDGATQNSPGSQSSSQQPCAQKSRKEEAEEEVKEQEKQRVAGVIPAFNVTYRQNAVPLSPAQKMSLALHSSIDWFAFGSAFAEAGYHEAKDDLKGFSWGFKGYGERTGVAYLDTFDGAMLNNGLFPVIFRQDPRYFRLGYGSKKRRILHSLESNFIAKNDYNGKWGPNYGNLLGNFAAGELSNLYYPAGNSGFGLAATNTAIQIAEGAGGSMFEEFWPDISRRLLHKDPTHGLDAQAQAQYDAEKQQKQTQKAKLRQEKNQGQNPDQNKNQNPNANPNPNQNQAGAPGSPTR